MTSFFTADVAFMEAGRKLHLFVSLGLLRQRPRHSCICFTVQSLLLMSIKIYYPRSRESRFFLQFHGRIPKSLVVDDRRYFTLCHSDAATRMYTIPIKLVIYGFKFCWFVGDTKTEMHEALLRFPGETEVSTFCLFWCRVHITGVASLQASKHPSVNVGARLMWAIYRAS